MTGRIKENKNPSNNASKSHSSEKETFGRVHRTGVRTVRLVRRFYKNELFPLFVTLEKLVLTVRTRDEKTHNFFCSVLTRIWNNLADFFSCSVTILFCLFCSVLCSTEQTEHDCSEHECSVFFHPCSLLPIGYWSVNSVANH